jgi:hypothetical protein
MTARAGVEEAVTPLTRTTATGSICIMRYEIRVWFATGLASAGQIDGAGRSES